MKLMLQRYLAAQFILPLVVSTLFFISFLLTFQLFRLTDLLVTRDISIWFTLKLVGDTALTFIPLSLPIAVFFSTIYCTNKMSADSEYIAMRASGLHKFQILFPFLLVAALLTSTVYQLNQNIIPNANKSIARKVNYLTSSGLLAGIKGGQFFNLIPNVTLFADESTKYGRDLKKVFLHLKENETAERAIFANSGKLIFERSPETLSEKLTLVLFNGNIVTQKNDNIEKILFDKYVFPISQKQFDDRLSLKEVMLSSDELHGVMQMTEAEAKKKYNFNQKDMFNSRYEYWNRKNGAFICFIFCFLGFTLGVTGNRGKARSSGQMGLVCLIIYYGLYFSLASAAKKGIFPVPIAVFIPLLLLALTGVWFYRKLDWQS
jgi:lipopolysaccharide export system permease protein